MVRTRIAAPLLVTVLAGCPLNDDDSEGPGFENAYNGRSVVYVTLANRASNPVEVTLDPACDAGEDTRSAPISAANTNDLIRFYGSPGRLLVWHHLIGDGDAEAVLRDGPKRVTINASQEGFGRCELMVQVSRDRRLVLAHNGPAEIRFESDEVDPDGLSCDEMSSVCVKGLREFRRSIRAYALTPQDAELSVNIDRSVGCEVAEIEIEDTGTQRRFTLQVDLADNRFSGTCDLTFDSASTPDPVDVEIDVRANTAVQYGQDPVSLGGICEAGSTCLASVPPFASLTLEATSMDGAQPRWMGRCIQDSENPWRARIRSVRPGDRCAFDVDTPPANCDQVTTPSIRLIANGVVLEPTEETYMLSRTDTTNVVDIEATAITVGTARYLWQWGTATQLSAFGDSSPAQANTTLDCPLNSSCFVRVTVTDDCEEPMRTSLIRYQVLE